MGRFGNVFLVDGRTDWRLDVARGMVVRFYLTNTANTRVFDLWITGAAVKLVGGDSGRYEWETFVDDVVIGAVRAGGGGRPVRHAGRGRARASDAG